MEFLKIETETYEEFRKIAKKLFNCYAIQNHETTFRLTEIEFYWNSLSHIDKSTYERIHVNPKAGEWFFHYSGVDIALKNEEHSEKKGYGGILIRGIYDINQTKFYKGPLVCAMKLFSCTNAFTDTIKTKIIEYSFSELEPISTQRINLGENAKINDAYKLNYRFVIKIT